PANSDPGSTPPAVEAHKASGVMVQVNGHKFEPPVLEVKTGTMVTWMNNEDANHTATADSPGGSGGVNFTFDNQLQGKGTTASTTFTQPGEYPYHCERHPAMKGKIIVK